jgi:hypothetical protein
LEWAVYHTIGAARWKNKDEVIRTKDEPNTDEEGMHDG